jgi:phosphopantetheinyl transferase
VIERRGLDASACPAERVRVFGEADGLWWVVGDWAARLPAEITAPPETSAARRRLIDARRTIGRAWARELVRERLHGSWPGFGGHRPGEKPRLLGEHGLDVSISHSGSTMLVAVGRGGAIGADVEVAPFAAFAGTALRRRMCSPAEREAFESVPAGPHRSRALARAWTIKEAVLKARGIGLAADPRTVAVEAGTISADVMAMPAAEATAHPELSIVRLAGATVELVHPVTRRADASAFG